MTHLLAPENLPFAIAALVLIGLTSIELVSLLLGFSLSEFVDKAGFGDHGGASGLMAWVNVGGVPLLILIMMFCGYFAISGLLIQAIARLVWMPLPAALAATVAFAAGIPLVRSTSGLVARIVPRDETYAVENADFVGRTGEVSVGPLDQGLPGRVRIKDSHGNWHNLRAKAGKAEAPIAIGAQILIVDRQGDVFIAIPAPDPIP